MSTELLITMGFVASRIGGVFMIMPALGARGVPAMTRILCILALTVLVAPMVPMATITPTMGFLVFGIMTEVIVGVIIGGTVTFMFGSLALACNLMSNQIGHGAAQLFDPMLKVSHGPIATLVSLLAAGVFVGTNQHLILLINVTDTFHIVPPGSVVNPIGGGRFWVVIFSEMMTAALSMAGPVLALVFVIHCFVAVLTKLAPQMNIFFSLGMIMTMVAGTWMVHIILPHQFEAHHALVSSAIERVPMVLAEMDVAPR
jgi:flagellar biosynthetic protein FliR